MNSPKSVWYDHIFFVVMLMTEFKKSATVKTLTVQIPRSRSADGVDQASHMVLTNANDFSAALLLKDMLRKSAS